MTNYRRSLTGFLSFLISLLMVGSAFAATTVGSNLSTTGTFTITPASDAVTAAQFQNAAGTTIVQFDSTNSRLGIVPGGTLDTTLEVGGTASISGIITLTSGIFLPRADSTTAFRFQNAAASVNTLTLDTTNNRVGAGTIGGTLNTTLEVGGVASATNLVIGAGTAILKHLSYTFSLNASTLTQKCVDLGSNSTPGAALGDTVVASNNITGGTPASFSLQAFVTSANNTAFRWCEFGTPLTDPDGSGATYRVDIWQH